MQYSVGLNCYREQFIVESWAFLSVVEDKWRDVKSKWYQQVGLRVGQAGGLHCQPDGDVWGIWGKGFS